MEYSEDYIASKDIDWYCIINGYYVHVASAGGKIPTIINDREKLQYLQHNVCIAEYIYSEEDIEYNELFLSERFRDGVGRNDYIRSFRDMARKGFISIDRTNWTNPEDNTYHVVCRPKAFSKHAYLCDENNIIKFEVKYDSSILNINSQGFDLLSLLENNKGRR